MILGSYTKLHASDFKEYIIPVNLGDASGKPFQITFENAEIVDFYTLQDDGSLRSVFLLNWYNNIIQYENSTNSGVVIDETLYDNRLIHHHIGGTGQAMPIPQNLHRGFGGIHNVEKKMGLWK